MQFGNGVVTELGTLPYNNLAHILEVAKENGHDLGSLLADAEASGEYQPGETTDLHSHQYYGLLEKILNTIDIPAFGVRVGKKFSLADYGVLGYACISSPTLRHFLLTFFRFQQLVGSSASFSESLREEGGNGIIEIQSSAINSQLKRFEIEEAIGNGALLQRRFGSKRRPCLRASISLCRNPNMRIRCRAFWVALCSTTRLVMKWYFLPACWQNHSPWPTS